MIITKAEIASTALTGAYDPTTLLIILCIIAYTVCIGLAGYFFGRDAARIENDKWWAMHRLHEDKAIVARQKRRFDAGIKGHETRKRIAGRMTDTVTGTECNR